MAYPNAAPNPRSNRNAGKPISIIVARTENCNSNTRFLGNNSYDNKPYYEANEAKDNFKYLKNY